MSERKNNAGKKKITADWMSISCTNILSFFFISGLTGLIYEILWTRLIEKIIGGAPFAVSIVLTVFMGGLGLGSYVASRTIDKIKEPHKLVKLYGILELIIGAYGLVLPLLLIIFRPIYTILFNHLFHYFICYNLITFLGCSMLLLLPATCMGATLPVLSRFYVTRFSHIGSHLGRLYGINTIGAAAGSLICGFWIINFWGVWGALIFAVILNVIIGVFSILISSILRKKYPGQEAITTEKTKSMFIPRRITTENGQANSNELESIYRSGALIIFAVSGFCAMAYEVIWIRLLGLIVGPTTYSFTVVLVTFITGLAIGSLFFGWLADRIKPAFSLLIFTQLLAALFALWISQIMGNSQIFFAKLISHFQSNFAYLTVFKSIILFNFR